MGTPATSVMQFSSRSKCSWPIHCWAAHENARTVEGTSCGERSMWSGVEARHRQLQRRLGSTKIHNDVCQCSSCGRGCHHGINCSKVFDGQVCRTRMGQSTGARQVGASRTTVAHCEWARACRLRAGTAVGQSIWNAHVAQHKLSGSLQLALKRERDGDVYMGAVLQDAFGRGANRRRPCCGASKENAAACGQR